MRKYAVIALVIAIGLAVMGQTYGVRRFHVQDLDYGIGTRTIAGRLATTVTGHKFTPVNVLAFGVKGDGTTDDTDSLQAVIDVVAAAGGGAVYCPPGEYYIAGTIALNGRDVSIVGDVIGGTVFTHADTTAAPVISVSEDVENCSIKELLINMGTQTTVGISLYDAALTTVDRVNIYGGDATTTGIRVLRNDGSAYYNTFTNVSINGNGGSLVYGWKFANTANENRLIACRTVGVDTAVHVSLSNGITVTACSFENFECGVRLIGSTGYANSVFTSRFENSGSTGTGILVTAGGARNVLSANRYISLADEVVDSATATVRLGDYSQTQVDYLKFNSGGGMNGAFYLRGYRSYMGATSSTPSIHSYNGAPEGNVSAYRGSIVANTGGVGGPNALYVKARNDGGSTGWIPVIGSQYTTFNATDTLDYNQDVVNVNSIEANITIYIPSASVVGTGKTYSIVKLDATDTVFVVPIAAVTLYGPAGSDTLVNQYDRWSGICSGTTSAIYLGGRSRGVAY